MTYQQFSELSARKIAAFMRGQQMCLKAEKTDITRETGLAFKTIKKRSTVNLPRS